MRNQCEGEDRKEEELLLFMVVVVVVVKENATGKRIEQLDKKREVVREERMMRKR